MTTRYEMAKKVTKSKEMTKNSLMGINSKTRKKYTNRQRSDQR